MLLIIPLFAIGAAIAIDSGVWYLHRRAHQNTADASALAGAQELLSRTNLNDMVNRATLAADNWKGFNNDPPADFANGTPTVLPNCWGVPSYDGLPDGVTVDVSKDAPLLFMRAFKVAGFNIGAHAKVCVGSPQTADMFLPLGIPILDSSCFRTDPLTGQRVPLFGQECSVALKVSASNSGEGQYLKLYDDWSQPGCSEGANGINNNVITAQFDRGAHTWCAVALPGSSCPASGNPAVGYCIESDTGNRSKAAMQGLNARLGREGACNSLYGPDFGTSGNGIDDWWEALCAEGVGCGPALRSVTPGPNVTFVKRDCSSDGSGLTSPRLVNLLLVDRFPSGGNCTGQHTCPIRGFAGFFIQGCYDDANQNGQRDANEPLDPKCGNVNSGHAAIQGMFINYVDIGGPGAPATPYGRMQLYLVQ